ncbi:hypothetical protein [Sphingomonas sp.]|uniref:hypothetical protein n=1 Tax=Sphingomonas sp. TaxID=28214 RepID=UPI0025DD1EF8|nr:hypothetical protein [Sphingomonas sp.]
MLTKRLFRFGYETPGQAERNAKHGWDDEDSAGVWIASVSEKEAMQWGRAIAEQFVSSLFAQGGNAYLWTGDGFAHWIEDDPAILAAAGDLPVVTVGEMPDFDAMRSSV